MRGAVFKGASLAGACIFRVRDARRKGKFRDYRLPTVVVRVAPVNVQEFAPSIEANLGGTVNGPRRRTVLNTELFSGRLVEVPSVGMEAKNNNTG